MGLLRYEKNEKQRILEMHKRASRPLYENFSDDDTVATFDDEFFVDKNDVPVDFDNTDKTPKAEYGELDAFAADYPELAEKYFGWHPEGGDVAFNAHKDKSPEGKLKVYGEGDEEMMEGDDKEEEISPKGDMDEGKDAPYGESKGASEATKGKNTPYKGK